MSIEYEESTLDLGWSCNGILLPGNTSFNRIKNTVTIQLPFNTSSTIPGVNQAIQNTVPIPTQFIPSQSMKIPIVVWYNSLCELWSLQTAANSGTLYIKQLNQNGVPNGGSVAFMGSVASWPA